MRSMGMRRMPAAIAAGLAWGALAGCAAPEGLNLKAENWEMRIPVGTAKFEAEKTGDQKNSFSLNRLKASEIEDLLNEGTEAQDERDILVSDGKKPDGTRLFVKKDDSGTPIDGNLQQTYLIRYKVPLGQKELMDDMQGEFNDTLQEKIIEWGGGGYINPPTAFEIPIHVNASGSSSSQDFKVTAITKLVYNVVLTFNGAYISGGYALNETEQGEAPFGGTWRTSDDFTNAYKGKITFKDGNNTTSDAAKVLYNADKNQVMWRSSEIGASSIDGEKAIVTIKFNLANLGGGLKYKPEVAIKSFEKITAQITKDGGKSGDLGKTGALSDLSNMLGGAEFERAYVCIFSNEAVSGSGSDYSKGIDITAQTGSDTPVHFGKNDGSLQAKPFAGNGFYTSGSNAKKIDASVDVTDITKNILIKNAPEYTLRYKIAKETSISFSKDTGIDVVLLVPLAFKVTAGTNPGDAKEVEVEGVSDKYLKLNVKQLDDMMDDGGEDFDLKKQTKEFGTLKSAGGTLNVTNRILPESMFVGLKPNNATKYDQAISLENGGGEQPFDIDVSQAKISLPHPALLIKKNDGGDTTFVIAPVTENPGEENLAVRIVAKTALALNYDFNF